MHTPTIGPNWDNDKFQNTSSNLERIARELQNPQVATPSTIEEKLQKLEQAKSTAVDLSSRDFFDSVIDDQVALILSPEAAALPARRRVEFSSMLIVELSGRFNEIVRREEFINRRLATSITEHKFDHARFYSHELEKEPEKRAKIQAPIDLLAFDSANVIRSAPNDEAPQAVLLAQDILESGLIGEKPKGALQDAILEFLETTIEHDPVSVFKAAKEIALTADGDPARQVKSIDIMFGALKAHAAEDSNPEDILVLSLLPWGVPLRNKIVQDFIDTQLTSLRADTGLIEYSDRDTRPTAMTAAIASLQNEIPLKAKPVTGQAPE